MGVLMNMVVVVVAAILTAREEFGHFAPRFRQDQII
jgi:hypothetical protein